MLRPLFSIAPELKSPTATILYWSRSSRRPKRFSSHWMARLRQSIAQPAWSSLPHVDEELLPLVGVLEHLQVGRHHGEEIRGFREGVREARPLASSGFFSS